MLIISFYLESSTVAISINIDNVSPNHLSINTPPLCFFYIRLSTLIPFLNSYLRFSINIFSYYICFALSFLRLEILFLTNNSHRFKKCFPKS